MKWLRIILMGAACVAGVVYLLVSPKFLLSFHAAFVPALILYMLSHILRAMRIFLLLYDGRLLVGEALRAHVHAAGVSMLIPWKLGEIYRVFVFQGVSPSFQRVLMSIWIERIWDTGALLLLLLLPALRGIPLHIDGMLILYMSFFIGVSAFLFLVLPENINLLKRYLIVRKCSERALQVLIWVDRFHGLLSTAYRLLRYRVATMTWITCGIWGLELLALWWLSVCQTLSSPGEEIKLSQLLANRLSSRVSWVSETLKVPSLFNEYYVCEVQIMVLCALAVSGMVLRVALQRNRVSAGRLGASHLYGLALSAKGRS